jgi:hypothetical protein
MSVSPPAFILFTSFIIEVLFYGVSLLRGPNLLALWLKVTIARRSTSERLVTMNYTVSLRSFIF